MLGRSNIKGDMKWMSKQTSQRGGSVAKGEAERKDKDKRALEQIVGWREKRGRDNLAQVVQELDNPTNLLQRKNQKPNTDKYIHTVQVMQRSKPSGPPSLLAYNLVRQSI